MQTLINSMVRFSAAMSLFSMEQLERMVKAVTEDQTFSKTLDQFEETMNAMTDVLSQKLDAEKRETLDSLSHASEDVVKRTVDGMRILDPGEMVRASSDLLKRTTDATSEWISKATAAAQDSGKEHDGRPV